MRASEGLPKSDATDATEDTLSRRPVRSGGRGLGLQRPPAREDLVEKGDMWDWIPTLIAFLVIYTVLFVFFKPNLLFSLTTTAGGDTGAHHYPAQYLIQELLPHFRLTGWAPGWYAGMPMLTFYFPFPFLLIAIFNWFLPYTLAFKFVTVLEAIDEPLNVFKFMSSGSLLKSQAHAVRTVYPTLSAAIDAAIMNETIAAKAANKAFELNPRAEYGVKNWFGKPQVSTATFKQAQLNHAVSNQRKAQQKAPAEQNSKASGNMLTSSQRAEAKAPPTT